MTIGFSFIFCYNADYIYLWLMRKVYSDSFMKFYFDLNVLTLWVENNPNS